MLGLFRLTMIVPLLVSAVNLEANPDKFSYVPSSADDRSPMKLSERDVIPNAIKPIGQASVQKRRSNELKYLNDDSKPRPDRAGLRERNRAVSSTQSTRVLAQKLAKEALKSLKMQETMKRLTDVTTSKRDLYEPMKLPVARNSVTKLTTNARKRPSRRRGRRKKKRKRHHKPHRNRHSRERGPSKKNTDTRRDVNANKAQNKNSIKRSNPINRINATRTTPSSKLKVDVVKVDAGDYIDFSSPASVDVPTIMRSGFHENESMVERLMKTTTKDPKKTPGDRGVEYSDYYSEDEDVLGDIAANKIQMKVAEPRNPSDRFIRQTINGSSPYFDDGSNVQYSNNGNYKGFDYGFENYPTSVPEVGGGYRLPGSEDTSFNYVENNYGPNLNVKGASFDADYSNVGGIADQLPVTVADSEANYDFPNAKTSEVQPVVESPQLDGKFDYSNGYEKPEVDNIRVGESLPEIESANDLPLAKQEEVYGNLGNQNEENPIPEVPQFPNQFPSEGDDRYSFPEAQDENRPIVPRLPLYYAQESAPSDKNYESNPAPVNLPNAMDQPLGKILETLGINVRTNSSSSDREPSENSVNDSPSQPEKVTENGFSANAVGRPVEQIVGPNRAKKRKDAATNHETDAKNLADLRSEETYLREQLRSRNKIKKDGSSQMAEERNTPSARRENISATVNETKEVASEILARIIDELEELKIDRGKNNKKEGFPCRLSGSWLTSQAGMRLEMKIVNHTIIVTLEEPLSLHFRESLLNGTWNITGHAPLKRGSPFSLVATDNRTNSVAVFVGSCRVCQGIDTIAGVWSVARQPNDCRDFQIATSVFNDIFRKTKSSNGKTQRAIAKNITDLIAPAATIGKNATEKRS